MVKFKKGDRVIVSGEYDYSRNGLGVIEDVGGRIVTGVRLYNGLYIAAKIKNVKHYNGDSTVVKVGDKIRILRDYANCATVGKGDIFIVGEVLPCGDIRVINRLPWRFGPEDFEVIPSTPPQKIQQDGYEYELVGPVKPDWLVDGAWVVRKDNGCKHQVKLNSSGLLVLTLESSKTTILLNHHIYDQYRPHTPEDFKWGDWAMYEGKRVFVVKPEPDLGYAMISWSGFSDGLKYVPTSELIPTF